MSIHHQNNAFSYHHLLIFHQKLPDTSPDVLPLQGNPSTPDTGPPAGFAAEEAALNKQDAGKAIMESVDAVEEKITIQDSAAPDAAAAADARSHGPAATDSAAFDTGVMSVPPSDGHVQKVQKY